MMVAQYLQTHLPLTLLLAGLALGAVLGAVLAAWRCNRSLNDARSRIAALTEGNRLQAGRLDELKTHLDQMRRERQTRNERIASLQSQQAQLAMAARKDKAALTQQINMLKALRGDLTTTYQAIAAQSLKENNRLFLDLAESNFTRYLESARQDLDSRGSALTEMVRPIQTALDSYDRHVRDLEQSREHSYGQLAEQLRSLNAAQSDLSRETARLTQALREPQVRGRWGELTLRRVAELAGMARHCDFFEQPSQNTDQGRQRPDMIVRLPGNRLVVVDAKVSLRAYLAALETDHEDERLRQLAEHARQVQAHVRQLAQKAYWNQFKPTPEFVVLFLPGEHFFSAALDQNPELLETSARQGVIVATPTTLIALLKSVALGWRQAATAENARQIAHQGQQLLRRLIRLAGRLAQVGRDLGRTTQSYNTLVGSYRRRVLPAARRFDQLGFGDSDHSDPNSDTPSALESVAPLEQKPRNVEVDNPS